MFVRDIPSNQLVFRHAQNAIHGVRKPPRGVRAFHVLRSAIGRHDEV
jgi:hypothetical protein